MTNNPVDLDGRRDLRAQKSNEIRRRIQELQDDLEISKLRQCELETLLLATPAQTWQEAAAKASYLLELFSSTLEAQDPTRKKLISHTINDLDRLRSRP